MAQTEEAVRDNADGVGERYQENWTNSYDEWQENAQNATDDYQNNLAAFLDEVGADVSASQIDTSEYEAGVNRIDEDTWEAISEEKRSDISEWAQATADGAQEDNN